MFQRGENKDIFHSSTPASLCFFPPFLSTGGIANLGPSTCRSWESHTSAFPILVGRTVSALEHWPCGLLSTWSGAVLDAFTLGSVLFSVVQVEKLGIIFNSSLSHPSKVIHQEILLALPCKCISYWTTSTAAAASKPLSYLT